ncbi:PadR family transcriptional regulator [Plastoroseomonas arctica]|uniref:PadR family transcriptional regulator n=1 Tax=Plastoroseomonas arctica TaxID=1509237 RepID=A0AAF1K1M1_9PROT|nr:PadR family transcriptional regulator [Plastoroseomonas arctica]MBR0654680.1 PadR family transcriptional regulator [Plastoroseomonas arctica]
MFGHCHHRGEGRRFAGRGFRDRVFGEGHPGREGGRGGARFFDQGELRLVVLKLIQIKPRHGYEIIKEIEERLAGAYSPSPGTIYPTLTLLEDLGQVAVTPEEGGKKLHTITEEGERVLEAAAAQVEAIFARIEGMRSGRPAGSAMQVIRAMHNLKTALRFRMMRGGLSEEQLAAIVTLIDTAARDVERA